VHLELPLEIRDRAQPLDHGLRTPAPGEFDHELGEDVDLDVVAASERILQERHSLLDGEHGLLVLRVADDADDDPLEDAGGPGDDVEVPVRHGVVTPRADGGDRRGVAHAPSKSVTRTEP
jgi:hypothetical protein